MSPGLRNLIQPLLYLVLFNLLPQIYLRPAWISFFSFALVGFRLWIELTKRSLPPRWLLLPLQLVAGFAVWQQFHSFLGEEAGGAFLTLLCALKVFELRRARDFFVSGILCVLVLMSDLLLDQGLTMTLFMLVDLMLIATLFFALQEERWDWKQWRKMVTPNLAVALKALPLVVLMFVLFPRFNTGFGSGAQSNAKTGISDQLRPGSLAELANSDELIFRASFLDGVVPQPNQLYWRAAILDISNGMNWDRGRATGRMQVTQAPVNPDLEIYLEPGSERFLFSLDSTASLGFPSTSGQRSFLREGGIYELAEPLQTRSRYYVERSVNALAESGKPDSYLTVLERPSPALMKFLHRFSGLNENETVRQLLEHFHQGGYRYSLKPPASRTLDDFLFKTKIGFCEHYAGTMATLLRDLHVPARVIVGFQGGNRSYFENYVSVRGRDAHSWVEYYDRQTGRWRRVDPTAQVEPLRLTGGSDAFLQEEGGALFPSWVPKKWARAYLRSRALMDEVEASWIGFLLRFDLARQKELLAALGMEEVLFRALGVFLILSVGLILAVFYFFEAQKRAPLSADEKLYRQLLRTLRKWKVQKAPHEGPVALLTKIRAVNARLAEVVEPTLASLIAIRYGREELSPAKALQIRRELRTIRKFKPLKD